MMEGEKRLSQVKRNNRREKKKNLKIKERSSSEQAFI